VQKTLRNFLAGKHWLWWQLWLAIKPNLRSSKFAEIKATLEAKTQEAEKKIEGVKVRLSCTFVHWWDQAIVNRDQHSKEHTLLL
jgi:hypothetical protein